MEKIALRRAESEMEQDYYSVLARVVASANRDQAQLRAVIYELARCKLRKDLSQNFQDFGWSGVHEQLQALDSAIDQLEADFVRAVPPPNFRAEPKVNKFGDKRSTHSALVPRVERPKTVVVNDYDAPILDSHFARSAVGVEQTLTLPAISARADHSGAARAARHFGVALWSTIQLAVAVGLGVALYAALESHTTILSFNRSPPVDEITHNTSAPNIAAVNMRSGDPNNSQSGKNLLARSEAANRPSIPNIPIPSEYGVYAVSDGHLIDLELLPIRVPDPRVAISTPISTPSRVHLPIGQLQFVVFRRDLVNSAPDRVAVRVVARVARALTFDAKGKATINDVDESWVVRSNSYEMRVAPIADNPEMVLIRPEPAELVFPAGRYALVLKNFGYDFTVDGPQTDTAHCLERTDTLNAPIYTECRNL